MVALLGVAVVAAARGKSQPEASAKTEQAKPLRDAAELPRPRSLSAAPDAVLGQRDSRVNDRPAPEPVRDEDAVRWQKSEAVGLPHAGRLVRGVRLPAEGDTFFTWDPIHKTTPNRAWRRWGTDGLIRTTLQVARRFARQNPEAPRLTIGDLSRPRGGDFGPQFGSIGHASHQNGLDIDIYYPRRDRKERAPTRPGQVDMELSQRLVDLFLAAGAEKIFVGPSLDLHGPPDIVQPLVHHDNHIHVRVPR